MEYEYTSTEYNKIKESHGTCDQSYYLLKIINDMINIGAFTQVMKYDLCQSCCSLGISSKFYDNICKWKCKLCDIEYSLEDHIPSLYEDIEILSYKINKSIETGNVIDKEDLWIEINLLFDDFIIFDKYHFNEYFYDEIIFYFL
jgi:hypothetical protein